MVGAPEGESVKVLVTGAGGQLGTDVVAALDGHEVTAADHGYLDVGEKQAVHSAIRATRPEAVINCAGWTAVDWCESDPGRAHRDNGTAVGNLAEACADVQAHLTTISTDYVFDGTKIGPYLETDTPNPQSVYGRSKLAGEIAAGPKATIVRTSWLCGAHGPNMVKTVLRLLDGNDDLRFVEDQVGHPTFTSDLAPVIVGLALERRSGLFHVTNQGAVSWFEFAQAVAVASGADPDRIEPIRTDQLDPPLLVPRPANSVLANAALRAAGDPDTRHYSDPLSELIAELTG